jgi:polysaccharide biosynthesis/export protein
MKVFDCVLLTGTHLHCKIHPRCFPAHSGGNMLSCLFGKVQLTICAKDRKPSAGLALAALCALVVLALAAGCKTEPPHSKPAPQATAASSGATNTVSTNAVSTNTVSTNTVSTNEVSTNTVSTNSSKSLILQEGDTLKISFPGAPNLDTTQVIRRDGKITLEMVGEYDAAGKTPAGMEVELKKLYASQIQNNEVSVTVQSSAFVIYVMGAVTKPGKIVSERPLTVLEALIEAGIDSSRSNLKAVQILRTDASGKPEKSPKLNFYKYIHNKTAPMPSFILKPYDIINVPERFSFIQ